MRTTSVLIAFLVACSNGWAQAQLLLDIDQNELRPGESTSLTLSAGFPVDLFAMAGVLTDILSSQGSGGFSDLSLTSPMAGPGTSPGTLSASGIDGILAGQLNFPIPGATATDNPIAFWTATYTAPLSVHEPFDVDLSTVTSRFTVYTEFGTPDVRSFDDVLEASGTIRVIPAPMSLAVLGICSITVGRRRRLNQA